MKLPDAEQLLEALADQLRPHVNEETGLVGIHTGGVWVAERLHSLLAMRLPLGTLDIAFYRDDFDKRGLKPGIQASKLAFDVEGRDIILVDDILYTGRTARAALNLLFDYGRPGCVRLAALLDRGGRQLPICAQFVGGVLELPPHTPMVVLAKTSNGRLALTLEEPTDAR